MTIQIDVRSSQGNTLTALGIATRLIKQSGGSQEKVNQLRTAVMDAKSPEEARRLITEATYGSIEFVGN